MASLPERSRELAPGAAGSALRSAAPALGGVALALVLHFFATPLIGDFYAKVLLDIGVNIVLAVSLTMVNGFTGQFSIGHAAFMMVGGYVSAMIVYYGSMLGYGSPDLQGGLISSTISGREAPFVTLADLMFAGSLVAGGLFAAACGYVVGLPSLRLKGDYLAIVTLGFGEIVRVLVQSQTGDVLYTVEEVRETPIWQLPTKVGGALGFSGLPFYSSLFWVFLVVSLTLLAAYRLKRSATGRAFLSIREDEIASEAMGVNTTKFKVSAFTISAFFAGVAGGLFAHTIGVTLNPGELGFQKSFDIIIMVVLGGLGSISGATIAAAIVTILPELLRNPEPLLRLWPALAGIGAVAAVAGLVMRARGRSGGLFFKAALAAGIAVALGFAARSAIDAGHDLGRYRMILFALALVLLMILRPQGLFGVHEIWERSMWRGLLHAVGGGGKGRA
ncbi:MAG: branched-chain amino acid ABC transporter permease [Planctomycetota bacterium]|nr:branched-chain amino acid ABC transporter permease [Planctomycetota bacterium]